MPPHPRLSRAAVDLPALAAGVPASLLAAAKGEVAPLHLGDSWRQPPEGCRVSDLAGVEGAHRYAPPRGLPALVDTLVGRARRRYGAGMQRRNVVVTPGATAGMTALLGCLLSPGDEVLIPAPHWPLIAGIVRSLHATPVVFPFVGVAESPESAVALVEERWSERTAALYLNSPNNPTGAVLPVAWLEALAEWARRRNVWLLEDRVLAEIGAAGEPAELLPLAPERTFAVHSFSKTFAMAGYRCGWTVGPAAAMSHVAKVSAQLLYSASTPSQLAVHRALEGPGEAWLQETREECRRVGEGAARRLDVPPPEGGVFLFLDLADRLGDRTLPELLRTAAERGVLLAPGPLFGPYPASARLCFSAAPPATVERAVGVLAELLGG